MARIAAPALPATSGLSVLACPLALAPNALHGQSLFDDLRLAIGSAHSATTKPQSPHTLLEKLLADADLDSLGRTDFLVQNQALRAELAAEGHVMTDVEWYGSQLEFVQRHRYWTAAARRLRDKQKQHNIVLLTDLLVQSEAATCDAP
jgi:hypothetical protein